MLIKDNSKQQHSIGAQMSNEMLSIEIKLDWNKLRKFFGVNQVAPKDYDRYHSQNCGTKYRGCDPVNCPKDHYERTGEWKPELAKIK